MALKRGKWKRKSKSKEASAKDKAKNQALIDEYGVKPSYWRYKGRKGIYWNLMSEFVRKRDFYKYGTCISCGGDFNKWQDSQAGHYAPAGNCGFSLVFDPRNINGECAKCNNPTWSPGKLIPYRDNLVKRHGKKMVEKLDQEYFHKEVMKEWTQKEYHTEILKLKRKIKALDKKNEKINQE